MGSGEVESEAEKMMHMPAIHHKKMAIAHVHATAGHMHLQALQGWS